MTSSLPPVLPDDATPLAVAEVAAIFKVCESTVLSWIKERKLRAVRPGRRFYVPMSAVLELMSGSAA